MEIRKYLNKFVRILLMRKDRTRSLALILILSIILPLFGPVGVWGQFQNTITYSYRSGVGNEEELESIFIRIKTKISTLGNHDVFIFTEEASPQRIGTVRIDEEDRNREIHRNFQINNPRGNIRINSIVIGDFQLNLQPAPKINRMESYEVNTGDTISFTGERLNQTAIEISGEGDPFQAQETGRFTGQVSGTTGYKNISFKLDDGETTQTVNYPSAFKLLGNIPQLGDKLEIIPGRGSKGSVAYIRAKDGSFTLRDGEVLHSVFFLTDATDRYSRDNTAEIISHSQAGNLIKIKVPDTIQDSQYYDVLVTNKIDNPNRNIYEQILERKKVDGRFFLIGADKGPVLTRIDPEEGPDTGNIVQVTGKNFDELEYIDDIENPEKIGPAEVGIDPNKVLDNILDDIIGTELGDIENKADSVFHLQYGETEGAYYDNQAIDRIDRYIATYIGDRTSPVEVDGQAQYRFGDQFDNISVKVDPSHVDRETEVNVILIIQTEISTEDGQHKIIDIVVNDDVKYTIIPSHTAPSIDRIIPEKIQVLEDRGDNQYGLKEDMVIAIEGSNFKVIRSRDQETNRDVTNYPVVGLAANTDSNPDRGIVLRLNPANEGQVEIHRDNEWKPVNGADMLVLDKDGNIVDGSIGRETGSKILINLPRSAGIKIPRAIVTTEAKNPIINPVFVMNPVLGSQEPGYPVSNNRVNLMFVDLKDSLPPTIDRVSPNVVAIDSGEEITVTGSNFQNGIRVFLGGVEVSGVRQELDPSGLNTILKFNAPRFPQIIEGTTKLMVMNPDGGQAAKDFTYVRSLGRDPVLMDFSPKSGTMGTVVVVDGDNFLAANPAVGSASGMDIYRLIGSRILMDGKDINEYNIDSGGNIQLKEYSNDRDKIISHDEDRLDLAAYYHSIILEDAKRANNFYTLYENHRGNIILSDGGSGQEEEGIINEYYIMDREGELIGEKDGQVYKVEVKPDGLTLSRNNESLNLIMKTAYRFNEDSREIYGSRVQVRDKNRIEFTVPLLNSKLPDGYTITVENPDTKKSTIRDLFYYYETVSQAPEITAIRPGIGSIEGGYQILIEGRNFEDDSKIYIDGLLVPQRDVRREIRAGQDTLIIERMPAYRRNMPEEETDRKRVPVVVENGNGGTDISRFTYVIPPSAKPLIDSVEFQKERQVGSAGGNEVLTITGRYFKFEEPWSATPKYRDWKIGERNGQTVYYEDIDKNDQHSQYKNWIHYDEEGGEKEELLIPVETYEEYLSSPVLPIVRIGGIKAKIVEFGTNYIKVITPQITPGRHELYVVNNDFGTSNRVNINFEGSRISIDRIVGDTGKRQGKDGVEILGSGFQNTHIRIMEDDSIKEYLMPKVRFGQVGGSRDINNNRAQLTMENGDFTVEYDYSDTRNALITMSGRYNKELYRKTFTLANYDGGPIYLPTWELKSNDGKAYPGYELVKIESKDRKLIVEKGYAPETELVNPSQIRLKTPSYHTIGNVQVEVTNPDGGRGTIGYRYTNPASKPRISNISRDGMDPVVGDDGGTRILRMDYRGGQNIAVLGEDFRQGARIQIGNIVDVGNQDIIETLDASPNKLAFVMPEVGENAIGNLYRLTVINGDGAQASSDNINNIWSAPIYIQFIKGESDPELSNIVPDRGPATGGTRVRIKGRDFREKMEGYEGEDFKIFFGDSQVDPRDIKIIDHTTIEVLAPESGNLGPVRVRVENPDGSLSQENLVFTYISKPKINDVNPKKLFSNDTETEVTIDGSQFLPGATVIVGGRTIPLRDLRGDMDLKGEGITGVDPQGNNREVAVIGGMAAASVRLEDGQLKVRFNEGHDLENSSIIIINPDGGISDPYDDFKYERPIPLKPMILEGIPGYESTVMLVWNESDPDLLNRASQYEIYGRLARDRESTYIGNTANAQYLIKGLEPNTEYVFMVRALNEYGAALDFAEVRVRTLSLQEDDKEKEKEDELKDQEKELLEKGKEEIVGRQIRRTLGEEDLRRGLGSLDFNLAKYKNTEDLLINIPLALARTDSSLRISYGELEMNINPRDLYTYRVAGLDRGDQDSHLQINISRRGESRLPRGKKLASRAYEFSFAFQAGTSTIEIDQLVRPGRLELELDSILYGNPSNVELYQYQPATGQYTRVSTSRATNFYGRGKYILLSNR